MWRTTFFEHTQPGTAIPDTPLLAKLQGLGHRVSNSIFSHATRCDVCHAELQPHEFADGYCEDKEACCMRRYSQRCW